MSLRLPTWATGWPIAQSATTCPDGLLLSTVTDDEPEKAVARVFPDYGAEWPVWGPAELTDPDRFSPRLVADLRAWQAQWEQQRGNPERYRSMTNAPGRQSDLDRMARHLAAPPWQVEVRRPAPGR